MKFILVYDINDHCEMGGGTHYKLFEKIEELEEEVNKLNKFYKEKFTIVFAGQVLRELKISIVNMVSEYKIEI